MCASVRACVHAYGWVGEVQEKVGALIGPGKCVSGLAKGDSLCFMLLKRSDTRHLAHSRPPVC